MSGMSKQMPPSDENCFDLLQQLMISKFLINSNILKVFFDKKYYETNKDSFNKFFAISVA
jgi:hypothetical protein